MAELSNDYPAELFRGALAEIERLDKTWRVETDAIKAQYESAAIRRQDAQQEMDRLSAASRERSQQSQDLRGKVARTAFALVMNNDGLVQERKQAIVLGVQIEAGQWIEDKGIRHLVESVETLDGAIANGEPIVHFLSEKLDYAVKPAQGAIGVNITSSESSWSGYELAFNLPYERIAQRDRSYRNVRAFGIPDGPLKVARNGEQNIKYDLLYIENQKNFGKGAERLVTYKEAEFTRGMYVPQEGDQVYVIGVEGISKTIQSMIAGSNHKGEDPVADKQRRESAFDVWRAGSIVTNGLEAFDGNFAEETVDTLVTFIVEGLQAYRPSPLIPAPELSPLIASAKRQGLEKVILQKVGSEIKKVKSPTIFSDPRVLTAAYDHFLEMGDVYAK